MARRKRYLFTALAVISFLILGFAIWYAQDTFMTAGIALRQETSDWARWKEKVPSTTEVPNHDPASPSPLPTPGLLLRFRDAKADVLLLRHSIGDGTYSYDAARHETARASDDDWQRASGEITVCEDQRWTRPLAFNIDTVRYRFISWDETKLVYPTFGKYAVDAVVSPSKKKAAVLSAAGPKKPFFNFGWPGLGGGDIEIHGRRYVQIMNLDTKEYITKPVILTSEQDVPCFSSCWSADERILIAYHCNFSDFQVVEPFH